MAHTLPGLPAELLLRVIESGATDYDSDEAFRNLRATCQELNGKLLYFFGVKFFKKVTVPLREAGMGKFQAICSGQLGVHINMLVILTSTLIERHERDSDTDSTDGGQLSWFRKEPKNAFALNNAHFAFDEKVTEHLFTGSFATVFSKSLFSTSLDMLPNPEILSISAPHLYYGMLDPKFTELMSRWLMTVESALLRALSSVKSLQKLVLKRARTSLLGVPISGMRVAMLQLNQFKFLRKLHLDLDIDLPWIKFNFDL